MMEEYDILDVWVNIVGGDPNSILEAQEPISESKEIQVRFDYPLEGEFWFTLKKHPGTVITCEDFVRFVQKTYREIYTEPEKYGVWGHDIEELSLEDIEYLGNDSFCLSVGS